MLPAEGQGPEVIVAVGGGEVIAALFHVRVYLWRLWERLLGGSVRLLQGGGGAMRARVVHLSNTRYIFKEVNKGLRCQNILFAAYFIYADRRYLKRYSRLQDLAV